MTEKIKTNENDTDKEMKERKNEFLKQKGKWNENQLK